MLHKSLATEAAASNEYRNITIMTSLLAQPPIAVPYLAQHQQLADTSSSTDSPVTHVCSTITPSNQLHG